MTAGMAAPAWTHTQIGAERYGPRSPRARSGPGRAPGRLPEHSGAARLPAADGPENARPRYGRAVEPAAKPNDFASISLSRPELDR